MTSTTRMLFSLDPCIYQVDISSRSTVRTLDKNIVGRIRTLLQVKEYRGDLKKLTFPCARVCENGMEVIVSRVDVLGELSRISGIFQLIVHYTPEYDESRKLQHFGKPCSEVYDFRTTHMLQEYKALNHPVIDRALLQVG